MYERLIIGDEVVTTGKLGIMEAVNRTDGKWLWAHETVPQNVVLSIDQTTGEKTINPEVIPVIGETTFNCPADPGSKAWQATSYSPKTGAIYLPTVEFCSNTTVNPLDPGQIYTGGGLQTYSRVPRPDGDGNIGQVRAVKLDRQVGDVAVPPVRSGHHLDPADRWWRLVFVGTLDRKLIAFRRYDRRRAVDEPDPEQLARVVPDQLRGRRQAVYRRGCELR